jgi:hypothetical protein
MKNAKNIAVATLLATAFVIGVWWVAKPGPANTNATANANAAAFVDQCATPASVSINVNGTTSVPSVTYPGSDGKNALELLQASHTVDATGEGFVNGIDGIAPGDHQFWLLCVNGKGAEVGAKDLATQSSDRIEWKLGTF